VLLTFFKISCPTCQYGVPFISRLAPPLEGKPATVWGISQDSPEHTAGFNREFETGGLPDLFDSEEQDYAVSNAYGITNVPTSFLIEQDGTVSVSSVGWDKQEIEQISKSLGQASSIPELTPFKPGESVLDFLGG
jgi:peroxiredoxin